MPRTSNAARINPATRPRRFTSIDLLHHQRGIGSAEAEAVVEHCANLPLSGLVRDQVDALGALVGIVEVERGRDDLVAHGEDAEDRFDRRSEEHTSELQSLMRISYAVFCLKKKKKKI